MLFYLFLHEIQKFAKIGEGFVQISLRGFEACCSIDSEEFDNRKHRRRCSQQIDILCDSQADVDKFMIC